MSQQDEDELYFRTLTVLRAAAPLVTQKDLEAACYLTTLDIRDVYQTEVVRNENIGLH